MATPPDNEFIRKLKENIITICNKYPQNRDTEKLQGFLNCIGFINSIPIKRLQSKILNANKNDIAEEFFKGGAILENYWNMYLEANSETTEDAQEDFFKIIALFIDSGKTDDIDLSTITAEKKAKIEKFIKAATKLNKVATEEDEDDLGPPPPALPDTPRVSKKVSFSSSRSSPSLFTRAEDDHDNDHEVPPPPNTPPPDDDEEPLPPPTTPHPDEEPLPPPTPPTPDDQKVTWDKILEIFKTPNELDNTARKQQWEQNTKEIKEKAKEYFQYLNQLNTSSNEENIKEKLETFFNGLEQSSALSPEQKKEVIKENREIFADLVNTVKDNVDVTKIPLEQLPINKLETKLLKKLFSSEFNEKNLEKVMFVLINIYQKKENDLLKSSVPVYLNTFFDTNKEKLNSQSAILEKNNPKFLLLLQLGLDIGQLNKTVLKHCDLLARGGIPEILNFEHEKYKEIAQENFNKSKKLKKFKLGSLSSENSLGVLKEEFELGRKNGGESFSIEFALGLGKIYQYGLLGKQKDLAKAIKYYEGVAIGSPYKEELEKQLRLLKEEELIKGNKELEEKINKLEEKLKQTVTQKPKAVQNVTNQGVKKTRADKIRSEILTTEETYLAGLQRLLSNIQEQENFKEQKQILKKLISSSANFINCIKSNNVEEAYKIHLQEYLRCHLEYLSVYSDFAEIQGIADLSITPIQRILRHNLLIKELEKSGVENLGVYTTKIEESCSLLNNFQSFIELLNQNKNERSIKDIIFEFLKGGEAKIKECFNLKNQQEKIIKIFHEIKEKVYPEKYKKIQIDLIKERWAINHKDSSKTIVYKFEQFQEEIDGLKNELQNIFDEEVKNLIKEFFEKNKIKEKMEKFLKEEIELLKKENTLVKTDTETEIRNKIKNLHERLEKSQAYLEGKFKEPNQIEFDSIAQPLKKQYLRECAQFEIGRLFEQYKNNQIKASKLKAELDRIRLERYSDIAKKDFESFVAKEKNTIKQAIQNKQYDNICKLEKKYKFQKKDSEKTRNKKLKSFQEKIINIEKDLSDKYEEPFKIGINTLSINVISKYLKAFFEFKIQKQEMLYHKIQKDTPDFLERAKNIKQFERNIQKIRIEFFENALIEKHDIDSESFKKIEEKIQTEKTNLTNELNNKIKGILEKKPINLDNLEACLEEIHKIQEEFPDLKFNFFLDNYIDNIETALGNIKTKTYSFNLFRKKLKKEYSKLNCFLGLYYNNNLGVKKELQSEKEKAVQFWQKAANQGNSEAQFRLGLYYSEIKTKQPEVEAELKKDAYKLWEQAAKQGHREAQYKLGAYYHQKKDFKKAAKYWMQAANQGHATAQCNLASYYASGQENAVKKDLRKAIKLWEAAAEQGHPKSLYNLGAHYFEGAGVEKNIPLAISYCKEAARKDFAPAKVRLGLYYFTVKGPKKDLKKAFELFNQAAEQKNVDAQFYLGLCYFKGKGITQNQAQALELWEQAASDQNNHPAAQLYLGLCYFKGEGVTQDKTKAVEFWQKAAKQGNAQAQFRLGLYYSEIKTQQPAVKAQLEKEACRLWEQAVLQKDPNIQFQVGLCYFEGRGITQNKQKGIEFFQKAADQGNAEAQFRLGQIYLEVADTSVKEIFNKDVEQLWRDVEQLWRKAALQGHIEAQYHLGLFYYNKGNIDQARAYWAKAASQGHLDAKAELAALNEIAKNYYEKFEQDKNTCNLEKSIFYYGQKDEASPASNLAERLTQLQIPNEGSHFNSPTQDKAILFNVHEKDIEVADNNTTKQNHENPGSGQQDDPNSIKIM